MYDVSGLIVSYNPDFNKLKLTIVSFLLQEDIHLQLIIADDGSKNDYFDEIKKIFLQYNFMDYKLIKSTINVGTVKNIDNALKECEGTYIKLLSPGDYLSESKILKNWCSFMKMNNLEVCGSKYICYYTDKNGKPETCIQKIHPQKKYFTHSNFKRNYLIYDDIFLGAAVLCKTSTFCKYFSKIRDRVKYAEDNTYRIMVYCGENVGFYCEDTIIYEVGTGISTSGGTKWTRLLAKDWETTNSIMLGLSIKDKKLENDFRKIVDLRKDNTSFIKKLFVCIGIRGLIYNRIIRKVKVRYTSKKKIEDWINRLKLE